MDIPTLTDACDAGTANPPQTAARGRPAALVLGPISHLTLMLLAALVFGALAQFWYARQASQSQAIEAARADALWLASLVEATGTQPVQLDRLLSAQFEHHGWQHLRLLDAAGRLLWSSDGPLQFNPAASAASASAAPVLNTSDAIGRAPVRVAKDASNPGSLASPWHVELVSSREQDARWRAALVTAAMLTLLALAALAVAVHGHWVLRRALKAVMHQADGLVDGRFQTMAEPAIPELRPLIAAMNLLVGRLRSVFTASAEQVEALRQQAHVDTKTGTSNRRHFLACLEQALDATSKTPAVGLVVLRLRDLKALDQRIGRLQADRALQALGQTLLAYSRHVAGCAAGRLNGADFALMLPVGGLARDTAGVMSRALRVALAQIDSAITVSVGAAEIDEACSVGQAMALVDEALAQAELVKGFAVATANLASHPRPPGSLEWRQRLIEALAQNRVVLQEFPVCTADRRVLHWDCPVRVHLPGAGESSTAQRWLAFAQRSSLCAELDVRALRLALRAIELDGKARCINLAAETIDQGDVLHGITRLLENAPQAASRLWIDVPEVLALDRPGLVQDISRRWRPLGVSLGLEHAGDGLARIHGLMSLGLDCVRVDSRFVRHVGGSGAEGIRRHLTGLVRLVQAAGLTIIAEGVTSAADLDQLFLLGFDAATGPAVRAPERERTSA